MNKRHSDIAKVKKTIKIHAEQLIRELGIADNGVYSEELGKLRAQELVEHLESLRKKAIASGTIGVIQSKFHRKGEQIVTDTIQRRKLAERYNISSQAINLCSIDRVNKQIAILKVIKDKIQHSKLYPNKKQKRKNKEIRAKELSIADENANIVYSYDNSTQIIKADLNQAIYIIELDIDTAESVETRVGEDASVRKEATIKNVIEVDSNKRIELDNGDFYLRSTCGNKLLWVSKNVYLEAYAKLNRLTLPITTGITA